MSQSAEEPLPNSGQQVAAHRLDSSRPVIDRARCVYCRRCAEVCPAGALYRDGDAYAVDYARCTACGACLLVCRTDAISQCGSQNTASASVSCSSA